MKTINAVEFGLYTNDEIDQTAISIRNVKAANHHETTKDKRLGSIDNTLCKSCNLPGASCNGHWGKANIKDIYFRPSHIQQILQLSNYFCLTCGWIKLSLPYEAKAKQWLANPDIKEHKVNIKNMGRQILERKTGNCWNDKCQVKLTKLSFSKKKICFTWKSKDAKNPGEHEYPIRKLYDMFRNIPPLFYPIFSMKQSPENLFYAENIPIPPILIRPPNSFMLDDGKKETHELTVLMDKLVGQIRSNVDAAMIQKALIEYDNSNILLVNKQNNNSLISILVGKNNILRWHILSGRKDQTCRTVVGPNSQLLLWEIGVPDMVMSKLSSKIFVNPFTISKILDLFREGKVKLYFNKQTNRLLTFKKNRRIKGQVNFKPGDWVEIDLQEGDHMIFGRQPSLHRHNVISSCVKREEGYGLKIPQVICNSQNADFDGDEIWGCLEQHPTATLEQSVLMFPVSIILHDLLGIPMYGNIQDEIIGAHLLGKEERFSLSEANYILKQCPHLIQMKYPQGKDHFTGKDLLSLVFNQNQKNITLPGMLDNGQLVMSNVDSSLIVGQKSKSLAKLIIETTTRLEGAKFINDLGRLLRQYLRYRQYGVVFTDLCPDYSYVRTLNNLNLSKLVEIKNKFANYLQDCSSGKVMRLDKQTEERNIDNVLMTLVTRNISDITKFMSAQLDQNPSNSLYCMSMAGYKMNPTEMMYIFGTFGQQKIGGKKMGTTVNKRILPYHLPGSLDPECRGFVLNPLLIGLNGVEYYFTMATARNQIVDIVCETSRTGSLARKILKKMEDIVVNEYGFVVSNKNLLKFSCNDIKMSKQDTTKIPLIYPNPKQVWFTEIQRLWEKLGPNMTMDNKTNQINSSCFMINLGMFLESNKHKITDPMESMELFRHITKFVNMISEKYYFGLTNIDMITYNLLTYLDPSRCKIDQNTLAKLFNFIESRLIYSLNAGYPIGIICAQTLSEKFTQQALSNFHTTAKSGGVATTLGFDKFLRLVSLTKNAKLEIVNFISEDIKPLEVLQNNFQFVCLENLHPKITSRTQGTKIYIDMKFDRRYLKAESIQVPQLEIMVETFFNKTPMTGAWSYWTELHDQKTFTIHVMAEVEEPVIINQHTIPLLIYGGIYKGKICESKFPIVPILQWTHEITELNGKPTLKQKTVYKLTMLLDNPLMLTKFDLNGIDVNPGLWTSYFGFGIEAVRTKLIVEMLETYGNGFDYLYQCCNLLASIMCHGYYPENVNNFKMTKTSVIKKMTNNDYKAIAAAAANGVVDEVSDNSTSHFLCLPVKTGTGFFNYFTDINDFKSLTAPINSLDNINSNILDDLDL